MRRPGCLVLMLAACATRTPASPTPVSAAPAPAAPTPAAPGPAAPAPSPADEAKMQTLQITSTTPLTLRSGVTLRHEDLVIEEIAAGPPGYPAGSGVTLTLVVEGLGGAAIRRPISLLSPGYTSRSVAWFGPYRVTVLDVKDLYRREAAVELTVEEVTDDVLPRTQVAATVAKGGAVELGEATMIFVGHGHKRTTPGQTSPLLLTTRYQVPGAEPEELHGSLDGSPMRWTWRDYLFTIRAHTYDASMRLEVARLRMAPLRPPR